MGQRERDISCKEAPHHRDGMVQNGLDALIEIAAKLLTFLALKNILRVRIL